MISIWSYYPGNKVRIVDVDGNTTIGIVECVTEVGERSDLEKQEDGIGIITEDGRHIEFYESDIIEISVIDEAENEAIA